MNKIITLIVKGDDYNHTLKWNSVELFKEALSTRERIPTGDAIITEAYIDDNMIDAGNTFDVTLGKMKLILGID